MIPIILLTLLIFSGCGPEMPTEEKQPLFTFSDAVLNYNHNDRTIYLHLRIESVNALDRVEASVTEPDSAVKDILLHDSGTEGDIIAGDAIYTYAYEYDFPNDIQGILSLSGLAVDSQGNKAEFEISVDFLVQNRPPVIVSIENPDSVALPSNGSKIMKLQAYADDPDGLEDIVSLTYEVWSIRDSAWIAHPAFLLLDVDTLAANQNTELDGYFTSAVMLSSTNQPVMNVFRYTAKDSKGNFSKTVLDSIQMYYPDGSPPAGVPLDPESDPGIVSPFLNDTGGF